MSPALRYHLQTLGALWVGLTALLFARREAPFARHGPDDGTAVHVVVTGKTFQDLSGAGEAVERGDFLVTFRAADESESGPEHRGRIAYDRHEAVEVGARLPARRHGARLLLEEDPRWGARGRRALWAWGLAATLFLGEGLRRICLGRFSIRTRLAARGCGAAAAPVERLPDRRLCEESSGDRHDRPG